MDRHIRNYSGKTFGGTIKVIQVRQVNKGITNEEVDN